MGLKDVRGLETTCESHQTLDLFEEALHQLQRFQGDPVATLDKALSHEPDLALGWCFRAYLNMFSMEAASQPKVEQALTKAEALAHKCNDRERGHIEATRAWSAGNWGAASQIWDEVLLEHPRDLLALKAGYLADFYMGRSQSLRDRVARVLPLWQQDDPGYGFMLGMYAFGLEECGDYQRAEQLGRQAVELFPADVWAIHAVAHVLEMQGRFKDGIRWMTRRRDDWAVAGNFFAIHNWWHLALYHIELEEYDRLLEIYDRHVWGEPSEVIMDLEDAASLLWRCHLEGVDPGYRWHDLDAAWKPLAEDAYYAFNDIHAMMAFAGAGNDESALAQLDALTRCAARSSTNSKITREVGLPVCRALHAFSKQDYASTVDILLPIRYRFGSIGGSHAQRDVLPLTLIEAALKDQRYALARALLCERIALKPEAPNNWKRLAFALDGLRDHKGAAEARQRAQG